MRIITIIMVFLAGIILASCSKFDTSNSTISSFEFEVINNDGLLQFSTQDDYQKAISYLNKESGHIACFDSFDGFESLFSVSDASFIEENCDEIIASILNRENEVIIQNVLFKLDFRSKSISAVNINHGPEIKSTQVQSFSFDDDIISLVFNTDQVPESELKGTAGTYCSSNNYEIPESTTYGDVELRMQYLKLGLYYSLTAKISKDFATNVYMKVYTEHAYCCWKNKKKEGTVAMSDETSSGNYAKIRPYSSMKRLKKYYFGAFYELRESKIASTEYDWTQDISCACSDCGWVD